jgi:hypothetical protein
LTRSQLERYHHAMRGPLLTFLSLVLATSCLQPVAEGSDAAVEADGGSDAGLEIDAGTFDEDAGANERVCFPRPDAGGFIIYDSAVEGCTRIGGSLGAIGRTDLKDLRFASSLVVVDRRLVLSYSPFIESLAGLGRLRSVDTLEVDGMHQLVSLTGLENLSRVNTLAFIGNRKLTSVQGLRGVRQVTGRLSFSSLPAFESLEGLENLQEVGGDLTLDRLGQLRSLSGLRGLTRVGGRLFIRQNPLLPKAEIDAFLARVTVVGTKSISNNAP